MDALTAVEAVEAVAAGDGYRSAHFRLPSHPGRTFLVETAGDGTFLVGEVDLSGEEPDYDPNPEAIGPEGFTEEGLAEAVRRWDEWHGTP